MKCDKCNHFFAIVPEAETKANKETTADRHGNDRKPPPPPRKVICAIAHPVIRSDDTGLDFMYPFLKSGYCRPFDQIGVSSINPFDQIWMLCTILLNQGIAGLLMKSECLVQIF